MTRSVGGSIVAVSSSGITAAVAVAVSSSTIGVGGRGRRARRETAEGGVGDL
jgi:hypothetical protein